MPYHIGSDYFERKADITQRCRSILADTKPNENVDDADLAFLLALFQYHDEWAEKSCGGVLYITVGPTVHGTSCFYLVRSDKSLMDISFPHAIRLIPSRSKRQLVPQGLNDYRQAARQAIKEQIWAFRDSVLSHDAYCPITGVKLDKDWTHVDHVPPVTFDTLLLEFTQQEGLNPLKVKIVSSDGTRSEFADEALKERWLRYHEANAKLRLMSNIANLQLPKPRLNWATVLDD